MSIVTKVQDLATRIATEFKVARGEIALSRFSGELLPERPCDKANFIVSNAHGAPENTTALLTTGSVVVVAGEGKVLELAESRAILTRGGLQVVSGGVYELTSRTRVTVDGTTNQLRHEFRIYDSSWTYLGVLGSNPVDTNQVAADGWQTFVSQITAAEIAATYATGVFVRAMVHGGRKNDATASGATWQIARLSFRVQEQPSVVMHLNSYAEMAALKYVPSRVGFFRLAGYYAATPGNGFGDWKIQASDPGGGVPTTAKLQLLNGSWAVHTPPMGVVYPAALGAKYDGTFDDQPAIQDAVTLAAPLKAVVQLGGGTVYTNDHVRPVSDSELKIWGMGKGATRWTGRQNYLAIYCDGAVGTDIRVASAHIKGITFEGEFEFNQPWRELNDNHLDTSTTTGGNNVGAFGMRAAMFLRGRADSQTDWFRIEDCEANNFKTFICWVEDFHGHGHCINNASFGGRSWNFVYCDNLSVTGNIIRHNEDIAIAVSRGCKNYTVSSNIITDSMSGIFISAVDLVATGGKTLTVTSDDGEGWVAGALLTLTGGNVGADPAFAFGTSDERVYITQWTGSDYAMFFVESVVSSSVAKARAVLAVPAALQGAGPLETFSEGSFDAPEDGTVSNNIIRGTYTSAIYCAYGPGRLAITGNIISRVGMMSTNEFFTKGTIIAGSDQLAVDAMGSSVTGGYQFAEGDWVRLRPRLVNGKDFYTKIATGGVDAINNILTLEDDAPWSYFDVDVMHVVNTAGTAIVVNGWRNGTSYTNSANKLMITSNIISEFTQYAIRLGSVNGSIKNFTVGLNQITCSGQGRSGALKGIFVDGKDLPTALRITRGRITGNDVDLDSGAGSIGIEILTPDLDAASVFPVYDNTVEHAATKYQASSLGGTAGDMSAAFNFQDRLMNNVPSVSAGTVRGYGVEQVITTAPSGVIAVTNSLVRLNISGGATITAFNVAGMGVKAADVHQEIIIRNANATDVTFTGSNTIRLKTTGSTTGSLTLGINRSAKFYVIQDGATTIVQEV